MMKPAMLAAVLSLMAMADAAAQYYPYYPPPPRIGYQCRARLPTAYGPRRVVCPIRDPKPVGRPCACPAPPPPPGYAPGPYLRGRTIP